MYGKNGDAVANIVASYQLVYPGESIDALTRGAEWTMRLAADGKAEWFMNLSQEDQSRELEKVMFGEGDHSHRRVTPPPGA